MTKTVTESFFPPRSCIVALLVIVLVGAGLVIGIFTVATAIGDYGEALEQTKQVRIVADAAVQITKIDADASKKTSWAFAAFWLVRFVTWVACGGWLLIIVMWLKGKGRS